MADEITLSASMKLENGSLKPGLLRISTLQVDQTNNEISFVTQNIGTSEEDVVFTGVTGGNEGYLLIRNLDATNFVSWGAKDTTMKTIGKLKAGEFALFRMAPSTTLRMSADTAACDVMFVMYGD